ncbi:hypothetical protein ACO1O0_005070 [Amphichorda felina]
MAERLEGKGAILNEFNDLKNDLDDPNNMFNFEEWVLGALDGLAPAAAASAREPITLLDYFSPPTYAFEFINEGGRLQASKKTIRLRYTVTRAHGLGLLTSYQTVEV